MFLINYQENDYINSGSQIIKQIIFDKVFVQIYSDAKYQRTELKFRINKGYKRKNVDLNFYIYALNAYMTSHPCFKRYKDEVLNMFDAKFIKSIEMIGFKIEKKKLNP